MKALANRALVAAVMCALAALLLLGATAQKPAAPPEPGKVVIVSTCDVKGKTSPCG